MLRAENHNNEDSNIEVVYGGECNRSHLNEIAISNGETTYIKETTIEKKPVCVRRREAPPNWLRSVCCGTLFYYRNNLCLKLVTAQWHSSACLIDNSDSSLSNSSSADAKYSLLIPYLDAI